MNKIARFVLGAALCSALWGTGAVTAQNWPTKPVRVVVPYGAGGGTTIQGRLIVEGLRQNLGASFILDNRPGAGGTIGAQLVADSSPDGYTLVFTSSTLAVNTTLMAGTLRFDPRKDLAPASLVSSGPFVLCVHPSIPARSVKELIALAKREPGKLPTGISEIGSTGHLAAEMLKQFGGIDTTIVPYKGGGPALVGLLTGEVALLFAAPPSAIPQLKARRLRGLAVTTSKSIAAFPDLPPISATIPGMEIGVWYGMFFPKGTPHDILAKLSSELRKVLQTDSVRAFYSKQGLEPVGSSPEELRVFFEREVAKYAKVIKQGNIKLQ